MKLNPFTLPTLLDAATPPKPPTKANHQYTTERIGLVVRTLRKTKKYSLAELETLSGVSASQISRIEAGTTEPGACTLVALERALDVRPGWVLQTAV